jgi:hypothetical protein
MLLNICSKYADDYELNFNIKKTKCLIFKPTCFNNCTFPDFYVLGKKICITDKIKYLGCIITDDYSDCKDISRVLRSIYSRGNALAYKFHMCSTEVKTKLFISYCTSFYGVTTWINYTNEVYRKINVAYKSIFRKLFDLEYEGTTYNMLKLKIRPFPVIERSLLYGF